MKHETISLNTKKMFATSLKKLLEKKPLSKISVSEIVSDCGVNRKTFYYHFENINELLKWMLRQEAIEVVKTMDMNSDYEKSILFVLDYLDNNEEIIKNIYSIGKNELRQFFYEDFKEIMRSVIENDIHDAKISLPEDFTDFLVKFYTEAITGLLQEWIVDKSVRNKEKTVQYIQLILHSSITNTLKSAAEKYPSV
ncbi:MAG: TetR/AcrR family transcriptional regulator [Lachnospiraceae bacterium]|nr:TetR/AcrR family transcriptional regulator [Lachnospiraceae bacterium]